MKRIVVVVMAVLAAVAAVGSVACIKSIDRVSGRQAAVRNFMEYGPIQFYGADAEHALWDVPYAADEPYSKYLTLDVYWNDHAGLMPIVVNIHGGGWAVGDKSAPNSIFRSKYLAARGYMVVNVNYRMMPEAPIPTQVEDVMGAVIWAKENAARFGADPSRVGVMGGSAGGHLAALVGWAAGDPFFRPTGHADSQYDSSVKAVAAFYGVFDLEHTLGLGNEDLKPLSHTFFLKEPDPKERERIFRKVSPKYLLGPDLPPTMFVCGTKDEFDVYVDAEAYHEKLLELGVPAALHTARDAPHGFDTAHGAPHTQEAMEAVAAWFDKYLK